MIKIILAAILMIGEATCGPAMAGSLLDLQRRQVQPEQCAVIGTVYRLDPYGDNNLSVRERPAGPAGLAYEKDELFTGEQVCVVRMVGKWAFVVYRRNGRPFSGWVHGNYIHVDG